MGIEPVGVRRMMLDGGASATGIAAVGVRRISPVLGSSSDWRANVWVGSDNGPSALLSSVTDQPT